MPDDPATLEAFTRAFRTTVPLHDRMAITVLRRGPDALVTMEESDDVRGAAPGTVHGGMLATLADAACALSLWGAYDPRHEVTVTTDLHVRYFRQPDGWPLTAQARLVNQGRRLLSASCEIVDAGRRTLATATATFMLVPSAGRVEVPDSVLR
ncbi:MAG: PaaI family thioesterase [Actinomycetota bacterium]|nr:PaaI family thioesterase [Actinomycetota bacterium]